MPKVKNEKVAGLALAIGENVVEFDAEGVVELSQEDADLLVSFNEGFELVEDQKEEKGKKGKKDKVENQASTE